MSNPLQCPSSHTAHAFDVSKIQKTQIKTPATVRVRQSQKSVPYQCILFAELRPVPIAGLRDREQTSDFANRYPLSIHHTDRHLLARRWLQYFPAMASRRISAYVCDSACIFVNRRFSTSSSFSRLISETCIPPYFDRQLKKLVLLRLRYNFKRGLCFSFRYIVGLRPNGDQGNLDACPSQQPAAFLQGLRHRHS